MIRSIDEYETWFTGIDTELHVISRPNETEVTEDFGVRALLLTSAATGKRGAYVRFGVQPDDMDLSRHPNPIRLLRDAANHLATPDVTPELEFEGARALWAVRLRFMSHNVDVSQIDPASEIVRAIARKRGNPMIHQGSGNPHAATFMPGTTGIKVNVNPLFL
jgi:hypothetical protein